MLHTVKELFGFSVGASDGEIGKVNDVYFDDERWALRYMIVETGTWLRGRKVLISPIAIRNLAWDNAVMNVTLSRQQVCESPGIDTDKPVSRQHGIAHHDDHGDPLHWGGTHLWGADAYPLPWVGASADIALASTRSVNEQAARQAQQDAHATSARVDSHLRSSNEVIGYEIVATDGRIGSVENFVFDDEAWTIRHIVVDTRKWLRGRRVLISPEWIDGVSWPEHEVYVKVTRDAIEASAEFDRLLVATGSSAVQHS